MSKTAVSKTAARPRGSVFWLGLALVGAGLVLVSLAVVVSHSARRPPEARTTRCLAPGPPSTGLASSSLVGTSSGGVLPPSPVGPDVRFGAGRRPLCGFQEIRVVVTDAAGRKRTHCLLAALTAAQQERGLMEVTDARLGGYEGMLFQFPTDQSGGFYMRDTPMPLSIAYLDANGKVVAQTDMSPCADRADCPTYPPGRPFRLALEVPAGRLAALGIGARAQLTVGPPGEPCPPA